MPSRFDLDAIAGFGDGILRRGAARHADAIAALDGSPGAGLAGSGTKPCRRCCCRRTRGVARRVGWFGRLLGRDLLDAEGRVLRERLRQLDSMTPTRNWPRSRASTRPSPATNSARWPRRARPAPSPNSDAASAGCATRSARRCHRTPPPAPADAATGPAHRRLLQLAMTRLNHRQLAQRIAPMLPLVQVLLEQGAAAGIAPRCRCAVIRQPRAGSGECRAGRLQSPHPAAPEHAP